MNVSQYTKDSQWVTDDKDPDGEITIEVISGNGTQMWPVQKVMKRITLGKEEALYPYILGAINEYMKTSDGAGTGRKPWWKLW